MLSDKSVLLSGPRSPQPLGKDVGLLDAVGQPGSDNLCSW